jgi:hypothetical protein
MRCSATTSRGTPCRNRAMAGHEVCQPHSGGEVGRPTKLTDEVEREILDAVRAGSYLTTAARRARVSDKTILEWLRLGRLPNAPPRLAAFVTAFERAEAEAEVGIVATIRRQIAEGDGRLGLELLARRHPERWGRNRPVAPTAQEASDEERAAEEPFDLSRLSDDDYEQLKELHQRATAD